MSRTRYRATITYRRFGGTATSSPACDHAHVTERAAARCGAIKIRALALRDRPLELGYTVGTVR